MEGCPAELRLKFTIYKAGGIVFYLGWSFVMCGKNISFKVLCLIFAVFQKFRLDAAVHADLRLKSWDLVCGFCLKAPSQTNVDVLHKSCKACRSELWLHNQINCEGNVSWSTEPYNHNPCLTITVHLATNLIAYISCCTLSDQMLLWHMPFYAPFHAHNNTTYESIQQVCNIRQSVIHFLGFSNRRS